MVDHTRGRRDLDAKVASHVSGQTRATRELGINCTFVGRSIVIEPLIYNNTVIIERLYDMSASFDTEYAAFLAGLDVNEDIRRCLAFCARRVTEHLNNGIEGLDEGDEKKVGVWLRDLRRLKVSRIFCARRDRV